MPEASFTLEDIRTVVREEIRHEVKPMINEAIEASELRMMKTVRDSFAEYDQKYDARFDAIDARFDRMEAKLDRLAGKEKSTREIVDQHSAEIMELKARRA